MMGAPAGETSEQTFALRQSLLVAGLFPDVAERRRVSVGYYIDIGRAAYQGVADAGRRATAALYEQLAQSYRELVRTLSAMRRLESAMLPR